MTETPKLLHVGVLLVTGLPSSSTVLRASRLMSSGFPALLLSLKPSGSPLLFAHFSVEQAFSCHEARPPLSCPLLHTHALQPQNAVWLEGSLPDACAVGFGCVAEVFRLFFSPLHPLFFFFLEAVFNEVEAKPKSRLCKWGKINAKLENE